MTVLARKEPVETIAPAVHLEFIQNQSGLPEDAGIEEVEEYHRAIFLHHHAGDLEKFQQQARIHENRLSHLETRLQEAHTRLASTQKLIPATFEGDADVRPSSPWNLWDRAMFVTAA